MESKLSILFVDDEENVLHGLRRMLRVKRKEWDMVFAEGGANALKELSNRHFDAIVTDMRMPGMSGEELLEEVQEKWPSTIRMILSGQADKESAIRAINCSHQYLSKPCDPEVLQQTITRLVDLKMLLGDELLRDRITSIEELPSAPAVYQQLVTYLRGGGSDLKGVGAIINQDPSMTIKILKIVNSAYFSLAKEVTTIDRAVSVLGLEIICDLVLGHSVFSCHSEPAPHGLNVDVLWQHSLDTANIAKALALQENFSLDEAVECFTAGLLHDIGKLTWSGFKTDDDSSRFDNFGHACEELEILSARSGAYLVGLWGVPFPVAEAIAHRVSPNQADGCKLTLAGILHVADHLARPDEETSNSCINLDYLADIGCLDRLPAWQSTAEEMRV